MKTLTYPDLEKRGRVGNQLWQIAATYGLAARVGADVRFPDWSYRPYFNVPDAWFDDVPAGALDSIDFAHDHIHPDQRAYMQDWHYIQHLPNSIRGYFELSEIGHGTIFDHLERTGQRWLGDVVQDYETVSLSVRRGDNADPVTHPVGTWPLVSMEFYRKALEPFAHCEVIVFSDDIPWCRAHLEEALGQKFWYVDDGPQRDPEYGLTGYSDQPALDWIDMHLMSWCTHHILANSTYSWWGAFLGGDRDEVNDIDVSVAYPDNWVGWRIPQFNHRDLMPPYWTELPNPVAAKHLTPRRR